jgi:hypothetical protein
MLLELLSVLAALVQQSRAYAVSAMCCGSMCCLARIVSRRSEYSVLCMMPTTSKASAPSLFSNKLHMLLFWDRLAELTHHRLDHTIQASLAAMVILSQRILWRL